ncbi:MAG: amino acid ABC transporter permease [Alphaproteobacteria bacterium]|nr:MAG: amino acid ABC transporter permease [Alphaproteobacteria bacterium]
MAAVEHASAGGAPKVAIFNDPRIRGAAIQILLVVLIVFLIWGMVSNAATNLARAGIASGFGFLNVTAGFGINISPFVEYSETSSYGRVYLVGLQNTLVVAITGIILATVVGFIVGIARLSTNWVVSKLAYAFVEVMRNIPLLLWIFIWYFSVLRLLPDKAAPIDFGPFGLLNIAGYYAPKAVFGPGAGWIGLALLAGILASIVIYRWARAGLIVGLPLVAYVLTGFPLSFELPTTSRFGPRGGARIYPEFLGLLVALSFYTAAYIAEIVRAGILAISHGQTEASYALGMRRGHTLRLVIIPQAMRVIIPPLTNQYLNLTKNSSLAVAIAYPDLVSVFAGTTLNQTGQAVEVLLMTMLTYLALSLLTSLFMNWFNAKMALVER